MCTAISLQLHHHMFGRNLDLEYCFHESVTITPRYFPFIFRKAKGMEKHFAMIGMATVEQNYPLYYDATNEAGLSVAALNFLGNAHYSCDPGRHYTVAPFEVIPWILCQCSNVAEAKALMENTAIAPMEFSSKYPATDLHWMVSDSDRSMVIEPLEDGLKCIDNPFQVLTNNPPFSFHQDNVQQYMQLNNLPPKNQLLPLRDITPFSRGMGALGLPGDLSSPSRFIRALFVRNYSVCPPSTEASVHQFFHLLGAVEQQAGCVKLGDKFEKTIYSSCCDTDKGVYYYRTYENPKIRGVYMHRHNLDGTRLAAFPLDKNYEISIVN